MLINPVSGDSMHEAGIHDGDLAIIRRQPTAVEGDVAAVLLNGETTLKTLVPHGPASVTGGCRRALAARPAARGRKLRSRACWSPCCAAAR